MRKALDDIARVLCPLGPPRKGLSTEQLCDLALTLACDVWEMKEVLQAERADLQSRSCLNPSIRVTRAASRRAIARTRKYRPR